MFRAGPGEADKGDEGVPVIEYSSTHGFEGVGVENSRLCVTHFDREE
jgi:hypothetical protein